MNQLGRSAKNQATGKLFKDSWQCVAERGDIIPPSKKENPLDGGIEAGYSGGLSRSQGCSPTRLMRNRERLYHISRATSIKYPQYLVFLGHLWRLTVRPLVKKQ